MRSLPRSLAFAGASVLLTTTFASPALVSTANAVSPTTWTVTPGTGTISHAVAKAKTGDTLLLKAGTFRDSVLIDKTLTIRGAGWSKTTVQPPATASNACNGTGQKQGFCVVGVLDAQGFPVRTNPVKNVAISGLRLTGFTNGVIGFNTEGLTVQHIRADHNLHNGIAGNWSTRPRFSENWTSWNGEAGVSVEESPKAAGLIRQNLTDHNRIGIFMQGSTALTATANRSWGNCIGIFAFHIDGGALGNPPAGDYTIMDNTVSANNKACPPHDDVPGYSGLGIALGGVHDVVVRFNRVSNHSSTSPSDLPTGGIVVFSTAFLGGVDSSNNTVTSNDVRNNTPADIVWDEKGTGNTFKHNRCRTVIPNSLGPCVK